VGADARLGRNDAYEKPRHPDDVRCAGSAVADDLVGLGRAGAAGVRVHPLPAIAPAIPPAYVANLATPEGMAAFKAQWKNMDVKIVEAPAMPNAGAAWKTSYDITPKAGDAGFDDASWPTIEPKGLLERRGGGHLFMTWFRASLTVPAKIGDFDTAGATAVSASPSTITPRRG